MTYEIEGASPVVLRVYVDEFGLTDLQNSYLQMGTRPEQAEVFRARRIMLEAERQIEGICNIPGLSDGMREECPGFDCSDAS